MTQVYDVIIIGAGAAGVAAMARLLQSGRRLRVLALEGGGHLGGRLLSLPFGGGAVDLGAQWCHGDVDNDVFSLVGYMDLLRRPEAEVRIFCRPNGAIVDGQKAERYHGVCLEAMQAARTTEGKTDAIAGYIRNEYNKRLAELDFEVDEELADEILDWFLKNIQARISGNVLLDRSVNSVKESWDNQGEVCYYWKERGFKTIVDVLLKRYPDPSKALPADILLNKEVTNISWDSNPVQITCRDGSSYSCRHALVTVALGALKERYESLFTPSLPDPKIMAIRGMAVCTMNKIYIRFAKAWWVHDTTSFALLWSKDDAAQLGAEDAWLLQLPALAAVEGRALLQGVVAGRAAEDLEIQAPAKVLKTIHALLQRCLPSGNVPEPVEEKGYVNEAYTEIDGDKVISQSNGTNGTNGTNVVNGTTHNGDAPIGGDIEVAKVDERPTWSNGLEFLMSCIAMSVGLGNIWRFPFTAYENGGGAFLIPYIIVLLLVGKPMYYMEMVLGQFTSRNSVRIWVVSPAMKGVGLGQLLATTCIVTYYVSLMALTLFYLIQSFAAELPWARCWPEWTTPCYSAADKTDPEDNVNKTSSSELYFLNEVLHQYGSIHEGIGIPDWRLTLCLLASWVGVFLVMVRGVKSSGKAAYFLALFPYVVMIALLIKAVTLEGAVDGIIFFITPKWDQLYNPQVWYAAVTQAFFSLSVCVGAIIMFSSYNQISHSVYRDAMIVTTLDTFTSLLAGFTIFGILGNLAHEKGATDISKVIGTGGTGLAFISYPDAIAKFGWVPQLFSVLFFLMLLVLGLGSAVSLQSAIVTCLADRYPKTPFWRMALGACISGFLIGLIYITPGGQYILTLVDKFGGTFLILGMAIAEIVGIFWIYGLEDFCEDLEFMTGMKVSVYWRYCWGIITPVIMIVVFLYAFISMEPLKYGEYIFPDSAYASGWALLVIGLLQLPIWAVVSFIKMRMGSWKETIAKSFEADDKWGPKDPLVKSEWRSFKEQARKEREALGLSKARHLLYSLNGTYRRYK